VLRPSSQTSAVRLPIPREARGKVISHQGAKFASDGQWPHGPEMPAIESTFRTSETIEEDVSETIERRERLMRCMAHARAIHGRWPPWRTVLPAC